MLKLSRLSPFAFMDETVQARNSADMGPWCDAWLLGVVIVLLSLGLVMVASASVSLADRQFGQPFYYSIRQFLFIVAGVSAAILVMRTRLLYWEKGGVVLLVIGCQRQFW